jgi:hypothetical protein
LNANTDDLGARAAETYSNDDFLTVPFTFTYTIDLARSTKLLWFWGWCAKDQATLDNNLGKLDVTYTLNGQDVPADQFLRLDYDSNDGQKCIAYILGLKDWKGGEHKVITTVNFTSPLNDGTYAFPVGYQIFEYTVYVKP